MTDDRDLVTDSAALIELDEQARNTVGRVLDRTLFVEAGAGTGKTTALVDRIVELVLTADSSRRVPLSQIAAITFTEAAAAELRERVRNSFEARLRKAEDDGRSELVERCARALEDADVAAISTLHAFAQRLLSEFPVEIGIPPRVEVIDEVRSQVAFEERWSAFLDELYDDPSLEQFIVRASILKVGLNGVELRNVAREFGNNWDRLVGVEIVETPPSPLNFDRIREVIHQIRQLPAECSADDDKLLVNIRNAEPLFKRFERASTDNERLRLTRQLATAKLTNGLKGNWLDVSAARECCGHLAEACTDLSNAVSDETLTRLAARIANFTRTSAQQRREEGVLEFHDLLVLAQLLLRQSSQARAALSERYAVLMLDEFQDTDPIQLDLAMLLASSVEGVFTGPDDTWEALTPEAGRLFMVGDPKQSIYRFRRADIGLFLEARNRFADGRLVLRRNFRTVSPIIDAVNSIFGEIMPEDTPSQARYSPLIATRKPSQCDHRPIVLGGPLTETARQLREIEAADVAQAVVDIRDNKDAWQVNDGDGWRRPELRDITILLPTRTSMSQLSHALDDKDIPFRADTGSLVYETQEIKDLLSVLAAIDDTSNQVALVAALRSPLYACGYDDLYQFVLGGGKFDLATPIPDALLGSVVAEGIEHMRLVGQRRWWDEPSQILLRIIEDRFALALPAHGRRARCSMKPTMTQYGS